MIQYYRNPARGYAKRRLGAVLGLVAALLLVGYAWGVLGGGHDTSPSTAPGGSAQADAPGRSAPMAEEPSLLPGEPASAEPGMDWSLPERYRGHLVIERPAGFPTRIIALTFDDGPDPTVTPMVLQTLAEHGAHATFFVLGQWAKGREELLRQEVREGHCVGNHSYTHPPSTTAAQAEAEVQKTEKVIREAIGIKPTCFRPPFGITNGALAYVAKAHGYAAFTWTLGSADTDKHITVELIESNVIHTPDPGDIVLMHDGAGHEKTTAKALPRILTELTQEGFQFVTLPELMRAWDEWLNAPKPESQPAGPRAGAGPVVTEPPLDLPPSGRTLTY
jgi:peptidoglycan/xylan/chitin deacetylase (PgdA/CDA1 family)